MSTPTNCNPIFTSGSVTIALDAPQQSVSSQPLPTNFRSMQGIPNISGTAASGSAQYSASQLQNMIKQKVVTTPLVIVDLRQETHGFVTIKSPVYDETEIAIGWFAERDWINVAKDLPSIEADERNKLTFVGVNPNLGLYQIQSKIPQEDGICTAQLIAVNPTAAQTEQTLVQTITGVSYLRLPTTDHCRPRDAEVDQFVSFEAGLKGNTWLHFHCRAGDGRTTTFMAMHDIIHNGGTPGNLLTDILTRQGPKPAGIGGSNLMTASTDPTIFDFPFSAERVAFMQSFYSYVMDARPGGFEMKWSDYIATT